MEPSERSRAFVRTAVVVLVVLCMILVTDTMLMPHGIARNMLSVYLIAASVLSFHKSAMKDPGRLSISARHFDTQSLCLYGGVQVVPDLLQGTRRIVFPAHGVYVQKYCLTCNLFRPANTSHCSECGCCVLERDHHCIWLNNCVGRNNTKHFFCFITALALLAYHALLSLRTLYGSCERHVPYCCYLLVVLLVVGVAVGMTLLVLYNAFLALLGITSREFLGARWLSLPKPDLRDAVRRACTIRPYIIVGQGV